MNPITPFVPVFALIPQASACWILSSLSILLGSPIFEVEAPESACSSQDEGTEDPKKEGKSDQDRDGAQLPELTSVAVAEEFNRLDFSRDGLVTYLESRDAGGLTLQEFRAADRDGTGSLSLGEYEVYRVERAFIEGQELERELAARAAETAKSRRTQGSIGTEKLKPGGSVGDEFMKLLRGADSSISAGSEGTTFRYLLPTANPPRSVFHPRVRGY